MVVLPTVAKLPDGGRFVALDSLRGVAALMVLAYHFGTYRSLGPLVARGWVFVHFFFVLSGFVIAAAYGARLASGFSLARFAFLRAGRLFPLHWVVLTAWLILEGAFRLANASGAGLKLDHQSLSALILTIPLLQAAVNPTPIEWSPQSWSISVELFLYAAFALAWRSAGRFGWAVGVAGGVIALGVIATTGDAAPTLVNGDVVCGIAAFGLGVGCWLVHERWLRGGQVWSAPGATAIELAVAAAITVVVAWQGPFWRIAPADAVFACAVLVFARQRGALSRLLTGRWFVVLGVLSYSLYMVHLLVLAAVFVPLEAVRSPGGAPGASDWFSQGLTTSALLLAVLVLSFALAYASWRWVEAPGREWSRRMASKWGAGAAESAAPTM